MTAAEVVVLDEHEAQVLEQGLSQLETKRVDGPLLAFLNRQLVVQVRFVVFDARLVEERIDRT